MATRRDFKVTRSIDTSSDEEDVSDCSGDQEVNQPPLPVLKINLSKGKNGCLAFIENSAVPRKTSQHGTKRPIATIYSSSSSTDEEDRPNDGFQSKQERMRLKQMRRFGQKTIPSSTSKALALAPDAGERPILRVPGPPEPPGPSGLSSSMTTAFPKSSLQLSDYDVSSSDDESNKSNWKYDDVDEAPEVKEPGRVNFVCQTTFLADSKEYLACVKFSPCGRFVAVSSNSHTIKVYSTVYDSRFSNPISLTGHTQGVSEISWSADSKRLLSASDDKTIRIWDMRTYKSVGILKGHSDWVMCVDFNPQAVQAISGSFDKSFRFWDTRKSARPIWKKDVGDIVCSAQFNPVTGSDFITALIDSNVKHWDTRTKRLKHELNPLSDVSTASAQYASDGESILASFNDSKLVLWKPRVNAKSVFVGHTCDRFSIVPAIFENRYVISGSDDGRISVWNIDKQELVQTLTGHEDSVIWASVHPRDQLVATADFKGYVKLWRNTMVAAA